MSLYVIASALPVAPTEDKIAIATSQGYFIETLTENPRALSAL
jgi:hypothetical protein